jgi:hypothetical protein
MTAAKIASKRDARFDIRLSAEEARKLKAVAKVRERGLPDTIRRLISEEHTRIVGAARGDADDAVRRDS